jgi:hypothetical protein
VQFLPGAPFPHVAQLEGGAPLRTETVRVQILAWGPLPAPVAQRRGNRLKIGLVPVRIRPGALYGACTGQANRDSVLTRSVGIC